MVIEEVRKSL